MHASERRLWFVAAAALLAAALAAAVFWATREEPAPVPAPAPAAARVAAPASWGASAAASAGTQDSASSASQDPPLATDPAEAARRSHEVFVRAVEEAAKKPPQPAPPEIANAKTFPEAFKAMQALQRRTQEGAPAGTAAINPFAPGASAPSEAR